MTAGRPDLVFHYRHGNDDVDLYDTGVTAVDLDIAAGAVPEDTFSEIKSKAQPIRAGIAIVPEDAIDDDTRNRLDREGAILPVLSQNRPDDDSMVIARPEARLITKADASDDDLKQTLGAVGLELHRDDKQRLVATPTTRRARDLLQGIQRLDDDDTVDVEAHPRFIRMVRRPDVG